MEDGKPAILVSETSNAILIADNLNEDQNFLITATFAGPGKEQHVMKLNRLKDKHERYQPHREFLSQCIESKPMSKDLKLELEPTIGNHDQEFSLTLMEGIVKFCDKTISKTTTHTSSTEKILKQNMQKEEFKKIKETISSKGRSNKTSPQANKF